MKRSAFGALSTLAAALVMVSCSRSQKEGAAPPSPEAKQAAVETPSEIRIGQTMPYSGPASAYGTMGKVHQAYFEAVNRRGGINGRKVKLLSLDDSYSPPKTVELVRRLVEQEKVQMVFGAVGTAPNTAIRSYLNQKQIPQLFVSSGATKWADPEHFPWTIGFNPSYRREGRTFAEHIMKSNPKAKIAVLSQNDDYGKDLLAGLREGLGDKVTSIVAEATYEMSDPTVDSQLVTLHGSKADTLLLFTTPKAGAQAIRKSNEMKWKATRYVANSSASVATVLKPAGLEASKGLLTVGYFKDPADKQWENDADMKEFHAFMKNDYPSGDLRDGANAYAYITAKTLEHVLTKCGDDFSGKNIMAQAAALKDYNPGLLQPGILINTSPNDFELFDTLRIAQFNGEKWAATEGETPVSTR